MKRIFFRKGQLAKRWYAVILLCVLLFLLAVGRFGREKSEEDALPPGLVLCGVETRESTMEVEGADRFGIQFDVLYQVDHDTWTLPEGTTLGFEIILGPDLTKIFGQEALGVAHRTVSSPETIPVPGKAPTIRDSHVVYCYTSPPQGAENDAFHPLKFDLAIYLDGELVCTKAMESELGKTISA